MDWQDQIAAQLNKDKPNWVEEWADQRSLAEIAMAACHNDSGHLARTRARVVGRVLREVVEPIVRASISAGVLQEVSNDAT